jgi:hypothetical protein
MPDPPGFVDYNSPDAIPSASARATTRPANFTRQSQRQRPGGAPLAPPAPAPAPEEPPVNQAGLGSAVGAALERNPTTATRRDPYANANGTSKPTSPASNAPSRQGQPAGSSYRPAAAPADHDAEPIDPNSKTMLKVGNNAYAVDLGTDPQMQQGQARSKSPMAPNGRVGDETDPLRQQMAALRTGEPGSAAGPGAGSARRNSVYAAQQQPVQRNQTGAAAGLGLPNGAEAARNRDFRNSAEFVVGAYPSSPNSGGTSPGGAPQASFMLPPSQRGDSVAEDVVREYGQAFPGERRLSRQNSRRSSYVGHSPNPSISGQSQLRNPSPQPGQTPRQGRPVSREGHAGIGANGRSASPGIPISRSASPVIAAQQTGAAGRMVSPTGSYGGAPHAPPPSVTPNSVGIALDPSGKVAVDAMADPYLRQQQQQQPPQRQQSQSQGWAQPQTQSNVQRRGSFNAPPPQQGPPGQMVPYGAPPPGPSPTYAAPPPPTAQVPPPPQQYQQPVQRQQAYQPSPYAQPSYAPPAPPQQQVYQQPPPQPQQYQPPPQQQQYRPTHQSQSSQYSQYGGYQQRAPSPQPMAVAPRSPSPQPPAPMSAPPTGQYTEDGKPVLFYGSSFSLPLPTFY